jgi:hypothetical protein
VVASPPAADRFAAFSRLFRWETDGATVLLVLAPASLGTPAGLAEAILTGLGLAGERPERVPATAEESSALGGESAKFIAPGPEGGTLYAWQQRGVIAVLGARGLDQETTLRLAASQQARLVDRLGPDTAGAVEDRAEPVVRSECPVSQPVRGARLTDGTPVFYVPGDPLYTETVPEACFKNAAIALSAGYHRAVE